MGGGAERQRPDHRVLRVKLKRLRSIWKSEGEGTPHVVER